MSKKQEIELQFEELDFALGMFVSSVSGSIRSIDLFGGGVLPPHYSEVFTFLVSEGFLEENTYGYKITHKGRTVMKEGGFLRKYRREMRCHRLSVIGIIAGIVACIAALITLYLQFGG